MMPTTDPADIDKMLQAAAEVALRMPNLQTLVIWYGRKHLASEFRCQVSPADKKVSMRWRATFPLIWSSNVAQAWESFAIKREYRLFIEPSIALLPETIFSHGAAMSVLELGGHVIHRVSLEQIKCETSRYLFKD